MKIKLDDIVEALEQSEERQSYADLSAGRILSFSGAENEADMLFKMEEQWQRYVMLPDVYEETKQMMDDFCSARQDEVVKKALQTAFLQSGAVCRFRRCLQRFDLLLEWQVFRHEALYDIARDWCEENNVSYEDKE